MSAADPSLALQKAIVARLKADSAVNALIAGRIYDAVPQNATKPYVSFGPFDLLPEHADCLDGGDLTITLDAWSAGPDSVLLKRVGAAVVAALDEAALALDDNQRLVQLTILRTLYMRDPDGITGHAVITARALAEPIN